MAELRSKKRASIPSMKFGLPERAQSKDAKKESGNYPMPTEATPPTRRPGPSSS